MRQVVADESRAAPRLAGRIHAIYVEATAEGTEARLLRGLRERCPELPGTLDLTETIVALRQGQGLGERQRILIVLDQFEQWLHAKRQEESTELVKALRQCDGERVHAIVMVRDDFWLAVSRFMAALEVDLVAGQNVALVDLFDLRHSKKVLTAFGRAFGALSENVSPEQEQFLDHAVAGLAEDGRVISVRLALFADMVKAKPWTLATLKEVGGTEGVGLTFLEETFSAPSANPSHRLHQQAARAVLKVLLPEQGSDIKGNMRSRQELMEASGYADRPKDFEDLTRILDNEVRLITPTDPEGSESDAAGTHVRTGQQYYQLTHDYLVPSLREWLTRKQQETRQGRAELRLADRAAVWKEKRENRHLPSLWEFLNIRLLTDSRKWTAPQRKMMKSAGRFHGLRVGLAAVLLAALSLSGLAYSRHVEEKRQADYARSLVDQLGAADIREVPGIVRKLEGYRRWADPLLQGEDAQAAKGSNKRLHFYLALLAVDSSKIADLRDDLVWVSPGQFAVLRDALLPFRDGVSDPLWGQALDQQLAAQKRFQAVCALATYTPDDKRWSDVNQFVAGRLVTLEASALVAWREALRPAKARLMEPLDAIDRDTKLKDQSRSFAAETLADYASDRPDVLFDLLADAEQFQFPILFDRLAFPKNRDTAIALAQVELRKVPATNATDDEKEFLAKRKANAAVALLRLDTPEPVWPQLKASPDPRVRSDIVNWSSPLGAEPQPIVERLSLESDVSIRRALVLMLGEMTEKLSAPQRQAIIARLLEIYVHDPDAGLHGAAEWLLRRWGQERALDAAIEKLKDDETQLNHPNAGSVRQWYVNHQKQTFVIVDARQGWFWMGSPESEAGRAPAPHETQHRQRIGRQFAIGSQEISVAQFRRFLQAIKGDQKNSPNCKSTFERMILPGPT
jgi:hypothetical protein